MSLEVTLLVTVTLMDCTLEVASLDALRHGGRRAAEALRLPLDEFLKRSAALLRMHP
jgi:hypothetical protein